MENLTAQEIFDKVARHLLTQKQQSVHGLCLYHDTNTGRRCAIGCLLDRSIPTRRFEGGIIPYEGMSISTGSLVEKKNRLLVQALVQSGIDVDTHTTLLSSLQTIHDDYQVDQWNERLNNLGQLLNLNRDILKEFR